jgi:lon-related putative ATP-dependent protease
MPIVELTADQVLRRCDTSGWSFQTTAELEPASEIVGQGRAMRALEFSVTIEADGYNVFVIGPNGTGRMSAILREVKRAAADKPAAHDWVYVHNFSDARAPIALRLLPGAAPKLRDALDALIEQVRDKLPAAFESDVYDDEVDALKSVLDGAQERELNAVQAQAAQSRLTLVRTASGLEIAAQDAEAPLTAEQIAARKEIENVLDDALRRVREVEREARAELAALDANVAESVVGVLVRDVLGVETELVDSENRDALRGYLSAVKQDLVKSIRVFKPREEPQDPGAIEQFFNRFRVNVFVTHSDAALTSAPVIVEDNPGYFALVGRIDRTFTIANNAVVAANTVDHMMLRPGALHRANGGYLVVNAREMLEQEGGIEALKRCLRRKAIRYDEFESPMIGAPSLEPQAIPLDVKVVVYGNAGTYWAAAARDEVFRELFKVKAEFVGTIPRTPDNELAYARFVAARACEEDLPHFERDAVAWLVEYGGRSIDDQQKLSAKFGELADVAREAAYWARRNGHKTVTREDMRQAWRENRFRINRYEDDYKEYMLSGAYHVATSGEMVGQINGMSVLDLGEYDFGKPARITARSYVMRGGINDVDRGVNYTDQSHNKGIAIIDSYLSGIYSTEQPLSVSANVTFEQSLNAHEGDSASCAILIAMLSAVSGLPIPQSLAITGTLDQFGFVRPIGGVNTKIEGFFDMCAARGLDGLHGVVIPVDNAGDLMLREDVAEAVRAGKFHVYSATHVDDLIELYFGMPPGHRGEDGRFNPGTLHAYVDAALRDVNEKLDGRRNQRSPEGDPPPAPVQKPDGDPFDPVI